MDSILIYNILIILCCSIIALIIEAMVLPRVIYIAKKKRLFDLPDKRKKHSEPIPRLGGITFTPIILLVLFFSLFVRSKVSIWHFVIDYTFIPQLLLFVCGMLLIYLLGAKDDLVGVGYRRKFIIQFIASLCIVGSGLYVNNLYGLFGFYEIPTIVGVLLSLVFITFTTNAVNLIDGADGLASGLSAIGLLVYGILFTIYDLWVYSALAFITLGVLIPFFYYNFFHKRRKIFMGDTGSLTLGFILAFMFLRLSYYPPSTEVVPSGQLLLIASPLFIPLFDALKVMVVRLAMGRTPFHPDRNHIHHKLIDLGFTRKKTVVILICSAVAIVAINWILLNFVDCTIVFVLDIMLGILVNLFIYRRIRQKIARGELKILDEESCVEESNSL